MSTPRTTSLISTANRADRCVGSAESSCALRVGGVQSCQRHRILRNSGACDAWHALWRREGDATVGVKAGFRSCLGCRESDCGADSFHGFRVVAASLRGRLKAPLWVLQSGIFTTQNRPFRSFGLRRESCKCGFANGENSQFIAIVGNLAGCISPCAAIAAKPETGVRVPANRI
jgi:hypothetical protein